MIGKIVFLRLIRYRRSRQYTRSSRSVSLPKIGCHGTQPACAMIYGNNAFPCNLTDTRPGRFTQSISTHISSTSNQSLPHPLPQPILDHARKNHQILSRLQQQLAHLPPRLALIFPRPEILPLLADAGDGPQEQRPDVAGDDGGKAIERGCTGADEGDRPGRFDGEEGERFDHLRRMLAWLIPGKSGEVWQSTHIQSFGPLSRLHFRLDFAHAEQYTASVTVCRADLAVVEGVGVV